MDRRAFITTATAAAGSLAIAGCMDSQEGGAGGPEGGTGNDSGNATDDEFDLGIEGEVADSPENLEVTDRNVFKTVDSVGLFGTITNTGDVPYRFVEVEATLNDGDTVIGEFVDTSEDQIDYLGPGEKWNFRMFFEGERINDATGFTITLDGEQVEDAGAGNVTGNGTSDGTATGNATGNGSA